MVITKHKLAPDFAVFDEVKKTSGNFEPGLPDTIVIHYTAGSTALSAINTFKELSLRKDGPLPVDGILMRLGQIYLDAGQRADAQQTFNLLVQEFPDSPFTGDAKRELESLKKT